MLAQNTECFAVRSRHEGCDLTITQETEQGVAPLCIKMVERLVEQDKRCPSRLSCCQGCMIEHDMHQHGLLLTAARQRRLTSSQRILQQQIGTMGAERGIALMGIFTSRMPQCRTQRVFDRERWSRRQILFHTAYKTQPGDRKGRTIRYGYTVHGIDQGHAGGGQGDRMAGDTILKAVKPGRLIGPGRKQTVALRQRALVSGALTRMIRVKGENQAVEKPPPSGGRITKQTIHLRRQPDGREMRRNLALIAHDVTIETKDTP